MVNFEDLTSGVRVSGILTNETVTIKLVEPHDGGSAAEVYYRRDNGNGGNVILYKESLERIRIVDESDEELFTGNGDDLRLALEAERIGLAHAFDPYMAVHTSSVEPLPHQISAVYEFMLPKLPIRCILADDPGAGKTIMAGLLIKEMKIRGDLKRCLIVAPGSLVENWQDELLSKFGLTFEILTNDRIEASATGNIFNEIDLCIARLDKLARDETAQEKLRNSEWDLIVCDEAHKMSSSVVGKEVKHTKRFNLGMLLSSLTRNLVLLTATPHNGKEPEFRVFLSILDKDRFEGAHRSDEPIDVSDIMRRLVKEDLLRFDGTPLFPERRAFVVKYDLSEGEQELYDAVTEYVKDEFDRVDRIGGSKGKAVGFALTLLQRRLASSPEAIYQSLNRRMKRLEEKLEEARSKGGTLPDGVYTTSNIHIDEESDDDDYTDEEREEGEDELVDDASASRNVEELRIEISKLRKLVQMAEKVRNSHQDRKWNEVSKLLQSDEMRNPDTGELEKIIIFTEHRDTLEYLHRRIASLLGSDSRVVTINGSMRREDRRIAESRFKNEKEVQVLIATDAAGEGINLQRAHLMINYDLPWNPNRLEQRFGRIHRIGQTEVCTMWNLVSTDTREGEVFERLFKKLETEKEALGGRVFDVLGNVTFDNKPLRDLLIEAVRYGNDPKTRARLKEAVDISLETEKLKALIDERSLTMDFMDRSKVFDIRKRMELLEARKLQPSFIESFFVAAFKRFNGSIGRREEGRYEISNVPVAIRKRHTEGRGRAIDSSYERICFDRKYENVEGLKVAEYICPGHPLMDTLVDMVQEKLEEAIDKGAILIDDSSRTPHPRVMFFVECTINNEALVGGAKKVISKEIHFIECSESKQFIDAGQAPYLDYRAPTDEEMQHVEQIRRGIGWADYTLRDDAYSYALSVISKRHLNDIQPRITQTIDKQISAIRERLGIEARFWDHNATELKNKPDFGDAASRGNYEKWMKLSDEMIDRRDKRIKELEKEKNLSVAAPSIRGMALVIPASMIHADIAVDAKARKAMEVRAMERVMSIERNAGFIPEDVSSENRGFDIYSCPRAGENAVSVPSRLIEVKGRAEGSDTVTVSRNEILTGQNNPETYVLALVETDGEHDNTVYLKHPFKGASVDHKVCSVNFRIKELKKDAEIAGVWEDDQKVD